MFVSDNGASSVEVDIGEAQVGAIDRWSSLRKNWANVANTPYRLYKNYSYEGGTATPFIAHWPAGIPGNGRVDHTLLHFIDFMPTLIELTGAKYPENYRDKKLPVLQGKSMVTLFKGQEVLRKEPLYFDWSDGSALRTNQWKIVREGGSWELYDMEKDRTETINLANIEKTILHIMVQLWKNIQQSMKGN